jgi:hypothetical protein
VGQFWAKSKMISVAILGAGAPKGNRTPVSALRGGERWWSAATVIVFDNTAAVELMTNNDTVRKQESFTKTGSYLQFASVGTGVGTI